MKNEVALRKEERFGGELHEVTRECKDVEEVFERYKNVAEIVYYKNFHVREDIKDDLIQEGMIEIWRKANKYFEYENKKEWKNYIYKNVKYAMMHFFRKTDNVITEGTANYKFRKIKQEVANGKKLSVACEEMDFKEEYYMNAIVIDNVNSFEENCCNKDEYKGIANIDEEIANIDEERKFKKLVNNIVDGVWNKRMKTTKKELKNILYLIKEELTDTEIAQETGIARKTIYDHRVRFKNYLQKNGY